ncbi:endonuclease domain-containing protein [Enterobacter sp. Cy-643]|uniref:endonuclease domain-containing protein n=1 Tax=Enterobacter sp. Cy-643 TaxID=2608346 RepID=UPI0014220A07|nr:DUF559 domain-containing protein [Enterobacter sp. Cy-643]NIF33890.1 endonuclease domain-containing protein [Enterobacter sp. Cy-643]
MQPIRRYARQLRHQMTPEENLLWYQLRSRRFAAYKFSRQHPVGAYIVDFACCAARLVIELDGGQHEVQRGYDERRTKYLNEQGWRVRRFWNNELRENQEGVLMVILQDLSEL